MTDESEPTKRELEQRVEQLEEYVSKMMPSRRDVLKAGGGGLLGGAAVLSATNSAAAADDSPDALGAGGDSMDVYLDQIRRPDGSGAVGDLDPSGMFSWSIGHSMPSVDTDILNNVSYFPPKRVDPVSNEELSTNSPLTSFTSVTLSSLPSDASIAILQLQSKGDGTSDFQQLKVRENGTSRSADLSVHGWAGHGAFDAVTIGTCPVDGDNKIQYRTNASAKAIIRVGGYL